MGHANQSRLACWHAPPLTRPTRALDKKLPSNGMRNSMHGTSNARFMACCACAAALVSLGCQAPSPVAARSVERPSADAAAAAEPAQEPAPERALARGELEPLLMAEWALQRGEHDLALGVYDRMAPTLRDPGVSARATRVAQFLNYRQSALRHAKLWTELDSDAPESHAAYGNELLRSDQILAAFDRALAILELGEDARFTAIAHRAGEDPALRAALLARLGHARGRHPESIALALGEATLLLQEPARLAQAYALTQHILARKPDDADAMLLEIEALERLHGQAAALERLAHYVSTYPQSTPLRERFGQLLIDTDNYAEAIDQFEAVLEADANNLPARVSLASLHWNKGHRPSAARQFRILLRLAQVPNMAHYHLGLWAISSERFDDALEHFRQVQSGPYFIAAAWSAASLLAGRGQLPAALEGLQAARRQHPQQSAGLYLAEIELLTAAGAHPAAHEALDEALGRHPEHARLRYSRAISHERRGDIADAESDFRAILRQDSDDARTLNALGYMLTNSSQRYAEAMALIDRALALTPDEPAVLDSKGWAHFRLGEYAEALDYLQQALAAVADHEIAAHLGETLWMMGRRGEARTVWRDALKANPDSDILREAIQRLDADRPPTGTGDERSASAPSPGRR